MFLKRYNLSCVLADDMGLGKVCLDHLDYTLEIDLTSLDTTNNLCSCFGYCRTKKRGLHRITLLITQFDLDS